MGGGGRSWFEEEQNNELKMSNIIIKPNDAWEKINYPLYFNSENLNLLKSVASWREMLSIKHDIPKRWIFSDSLLIKILTAPEYKTTEIIENVKRDELVNYYRDASVVIVSSRDEGGPRVALEALYLEVPVLSTNVGHMDSILPQELLAKKNDQESLQKLLETYVDDIGLINQNAIFEFITEEFSVQDKILQTHEVYESLINNR